MEKPNVTDLRYRDPSGGFDSLLWANDNSVYIGCLEARLRNKKAEVHRLRKGLKTIKAYPKITRGTARFIQKLLK